MTYPAILILVVVFIVAVQRSDRRMRREIEQERRQMLRAARRIAATGEIRPDDSVMAVVHGLRPLRCPQSGGPGVEVTAELVGCPRCGALLVACGDTVPDHDSDDILGELLRED